MTGRDSVFLQALGDQAGFLRPEVWEYVAGPPEESREDHGEGVFEIAGSPYRRLAGLFRLIGGADAALSAYERGVPFTIINRPDPRERGKLYAERLFHFQRGQQRIVDTLQLGRSPGTLVNTLGERRRLQLLLVCTVTSDGSLRLHSKSVRIRIGSRAIRLPKLLGIAVEAIDGWDQEQARRTIDLCARNPLFGIVLRYRRWFAYEYRKE